MEVAMNRLAHYDELLKADLADDAAEEFEKLDVVHVLPRLRCLRLRALSGHPMIRSSLVSTVDNAVRRGIRSHFPPAPESANAFQRSRKKVARFETLA